MNLVGVVKLLKSQTAPNQVGELTSFGLCWYVANVTPFTISKVEFYIGLSTNFIKMVVVP